MRNVHAPALEALKAIVAELPEPFTLGGHDAIRRQ